MTRMPEGRPTVAALVPGLHGHPFVVAPASTHQRLATELGTAGYAVATVRTGDVTGFRGAQERIAQALDLPETAGRNLDALTDSLRDLDCSPEQPLALLWLGAEAVVRRDLIGWHRLTDVLREGPDGFETVAFVDGFGTE